MGTPITWRNVEAANPALASRPMEAAGNSVNNAFDIFSKLIQQRQGVDNANMAAVEEGGKQAYLDRLQQAKTPEEVAALEASGELNTLAQGLSATTRAQLRGAAEARLTSTRQGVTAGQQYEDGVIARRDRPREQEVAALLGRGEFEGARTLAAGLVNPGPSLNAVNTAEQATIKFKADQAKAAREAREAADLHPLKLDQIKAATAASGAATIASVAASDAADARMKAEAEDRGKLQASAKAASEMSLLRDAGNVYVDGVFNPGDSQGLTEFMVKNGIGNDAAARAAITQRIAALGGEYELEYVDGNNKLAKKKVPIPLSLVKQAILGANGGTLWDTDDDFADTAEENLKKSLRAVSEQRLGDGRVYKQNKAVFDFDQYVQARVKASENPAPGTKKPK